MEQNVASYGSDIRWKRIIMITQMILVGVIFLVEVADNILLYVTRSQGYGPDTIATKLLRYLVLTTIFNLVSVGVGQIIVRKTDKMTLQKYALIITTILVCTNVSFSHYQFAGTFAIFAVPIVLSILCEDRKVCHFSMVPGSAGMLSGIIARGMDPLYNRDIIPEAVIAYAFLVAIYEFSALSLRTLSERRKKMNEALVEAEKAKHLQEVEQMSVQTLSMLAQTIDAKDKYTNGHSYRVAEYAMKLGRAIGYGEDELKMLRQEALLHDIGKIGVPDSILNKPGKLSDMEFKVMKSHTTAGSDILKNMITVPGAADVARSHHERYDGKGYPKGIVGTDIPEHARVVGICDAYDAMSSDRIYRKALTKDAIRIQLQNGCGTQFDPNMLDAFLLLFESDQLQIEMNALRDLTNGDLSGSLQNLAEDLQNFVTQIMDIGEQLEGGPLEVGRNDFSRIYDYTRKLEQRYQHTFNLVMIEMTPVEDMEVSEQDIAQAADAMEIAIKKNIRGVDIYMRYSKMQHMVLLMNAGAENVDMIVQRAMIDYEALYAEKKFTVRHEV